MKMNDLSKRKNIGRQLKNDYGNWKRNIATQSAVTFIKNFTNPSKLIEKVRFQVRRDSIAYITWV